MDKEQPDRESGSALLDRQVEGDWLLVDESLVDKIPKKNENDQEVDNSQFESGGVAYLDD